MRWAVRFAILSVIGVVCLLSAGPAGAAPGIVKCSMSAYLMDLYHLDYQGGTFGADIWISSVCPDSTDVLHRIEMMNGDSTMTVAHYRTFPRPHAYWSYLEFNGQFRTDWNMADFPFGHHHLVVDAEEVEIDTSQFQYLADHPDSTYNHTIHVAGSRITGFRIGTDVRTYESTFADPLLPHGTKSYYARMWIYIDLADTWNMAFVKLLFPAFAAAVFTLLTFRMPPRSTEIMLGRMALLGALLFVVAVDMQQASTELGSMVTGFTLVEKVHLATIAYIIFAAVITMICWHRTAVRPAHQHLITYEPDRLDAVAAVAGSVVYVAVNAAMIANAATGG